MSGKLIYSAFRTCINLNSKKITIKTGFVVQCHILSLPKYRDILSLYILQSIIYVSKVMWHNFIYKHKKQNWPGPALLLKLKHLVWFLAHSSSTGTEISSCPVWLHLDSQCSYSSWPPDWRPIAPGIHGNLVGVQNGDSERSVEPLHEQLKIAYEICIWWYQMNMQVCFLALVWNNKNT